MNDRFDRFVIRMIAMMLGAVLGLLLATGSRVRDVQRKIDAIHKMVIVENDHAEEQQP